MVNKKIRKSSGFPLRSFWNCAPRYSSKLSSPELGSDTNSPVVQRCSQQFCLFQVLFFGQDRTKKGNVVITIWLFNIAMENPNHKWWFLAGKIIYFYGPFSMAMLNNQRVTPIGNHPQNHHFYGSTFNHPQLVAGQPTWSTSEGQIDLIVDVTCMYLLYIQTIYVYAYIYTYSICLYTYMYTYETYIVYVSLQVCIDSTLFLIDRIPFQSGPATSSSKGITSRVPSCTVTSSCWCD